MWKLRILKLNTTKNNEVWQQVLKITNYKWIKKTFIPEYHRKQPSLEKLFILLQTDDVHTINVFIDYISISLNG